MPEQREFTPTGAENFKFPEENPASDFEKKNSKQIEEFARAAEETIFAGLAGKTVAGGMRIVANEGKPLKHYSAKNSVWATAEGAERGGVVPISDLSGTPEGKKLMETFFTENQILDEDMKKAIEKQLKKWTN